MRHLTDEERMLLEALRMVDDHVRYLLSEKWVNTAIECCVSQRRYQHWVMEAFSKSMVCRRHKERKNADFLRDSEGEPDLEKIYDFVYQRLGHKMRVTKSFYGYYFSDNYERFLSIVLKRAALWLKRLDWHPAPDICKLLYNSDEQWVYFAYKDNIYELQMHGYENRLFIKDAKQEIRILRHSILCDETRLRTEFLAGNKVPTVSGAEYDESTFCKILAAAIDKDEKVLEFEEVAREVI